MRPFGTIAMALTLATTAACGSSGKSDSAQAASDNAATTTGLPSSTAPTATAAPDGQKTDTKADVAAITQLADAAANMKNLAQTCKTRYSPAFVAAVYADVKTCLQSDAGDTDPATGASVSHVVVSGDSATAKVTDKIGDAEGAGGTWHFIRTNGTWLVSEFGIDYLRAEYPSDLGDYKSTSADDPFADAAYRKCAFSAMQATDDSTFRTLAYGMSSDRNDQLGSVFATCDKVAPGGQSPFRIIFESGVKEGAAGLSQQFIDCVITDLRATVAGAEITDATLNGVASTLGKKLLKQEGTSFDTCAKKKGMSVTPTVVAPHKAVIPHGPTRTATPTAAPAGPAAAPTSPTAVQPSSTDAPSVQ